MPRRKKAKSATLVTGADRFSTLHDSMVQHVISFLPAQAAVRTCVLARRWRDLWRSTTSMRIVTLDDDEEFNVQDLRKFVDYLLILRESTDLDTVEIKFDEFSDEDQPYVNLWLRFAVMRKVRALTLHFSGNLYLYLDDLPLVSRHLRRLDLGGVGLKAAFLDFAGCPAMENLKISIFHIGVGEISSRSLKHLSITSSNLDRRLRVSAPGLISLELDDFIGTTPFLENMPLLETAHVDLGEDCVDVCLNYESGIFCGVYSNACGNCVSINDDCSNDCVLLSGISSAKHLRLISEPGNFIFTRDLKHCPTFSKLKTLLLNEYWCQDPDLRPLACILKSSPVLEKLTLQLFSTGPNYKVEIKGKYSSMKETSAISDHLKVEVKCNKVNKRILKVLKFLSAFSIRFSFD